MRSRRAAGGRAAGSSGGRRTAAAEGGPGGAEEWGAPHSLVEAGSGVDGRANGDTAHSSPSPSPSPSPQLGGAAPAGNGLHATGWWNWGSSARRTGAAQQQQRG